MGKISILMKNLSPYIGYLELVKSPYFTSPLFVLFSQTREHLNFLYKTFFSHQNEV